MESMNHIGEKSWQADYGNGRRITYHYDNSVDVHTLIRDRSLDPDRKILEVIIIDDFEAIEVNSMVTVRWKLLPEDNDE